MIQIFQTKDEYNAYTKSGATMQSGILYYVADDGSCHFVTNNIEGSFKEYDRIDGEGMVKPTGNINITENGMDIDVAQYATATVSVVTPPKTLFVEGLEYDSAVTGSGAYSGGGSSYPNNIPSMWEYIKSVIIPNGYTSINGNAFQNCSKLKEITIPNSITSIGQYAFYGCSNLTGVTIPDGVTSIGQHAFNGCTSLTDIAIPSGITQLSNYIFNGCSSINSVTIPDSVTSIGTCAFTRCSSLKKFNSNVDGVLILPSAVTSVDYGAFWGCSSINSVTIPDSVTSIGEYCFNGLSITSVTLPSGITTIGQQAFGSCYSLSSVTILATTPPTCGPSAFLGNASGRKIYVPAESVEAYKTAWTGVGYQNDIYPIPTT